MNFGGITEIQAPLEKVIINIILRILFRGIFKMEFPVESLENTFCPKETPILCGRSSIARGLCVKGVGECSERSEKRPILQLDNMNGGKNYGYTSENLGRGCYSFSKDYEKSFDLPDRVPDTFSLMTYNIWGLSSHKKFVKLFKLRKELLLKTLTDSGVDMFCLQEMSKESYQEMKEWISQYKFASEVPYPANDVDRNRNVEVYFVSKYRPRKITIYGILGVLGYKNSLIIIEYPNLVIFNLYSQAGSKHSIGQENMWIHYSRCRYDIMSMIYEMLPKNIAVIICGDFNFHLDGTVADWPEMDMIKKFESAGFIDAYRKIHKVGGLTENTYDNLMRWNQKLVHKKFRYDGILYRPKGWEVVGAEVIGKKRTYLGVEDSEWFYKEISEASKLNQGMAKMRGVRKTRRGFTVPINASDHFGVAVKFRMRYVKTRKIKK
jgi:exonuclease III